MNIEHYLSNDELKEIARTEFADMVRKHLSDEDSIRRVLSNAAYGTVYKVVDDHFGDDAKAILEDKVITLISKLGIFELFRKPDAWSRETNSAYDFLQKTIASNRPLIEDKVIDILNNEIASVAKDDIKEVILDSIARSVSAL